MATNKTDNSVEINIMEVARSEITFMVRGDTPIILNAMSEKARQQLLLPPVKKNAAAKASTLKHDPLEEFAGSMYRARSADSPTEIVVPATAFKSALQGAALDIPGATKSQIGRLAYVVGDEICLYGIPQLLMSTTRCRDINRTPDIRTRAIVPEWACYVTIRHTTPILKSQDVMQLFSAAGYTQGIGDWRIQKGSGNYGAFSLVGDDDEAFQRIISEGGREAQLAAIDAPISYNADTDRLLAWFGAEAKRRGF